MSQEVTVAVTPGRGCCHFFTYNWFITEYFSSCGHASSQPPGGDIPHTRRAEEEENSSPSLNISLFYLHHLICFKAHVHEGETRSTVTTFSFESPVILVTLKSNSKCTHTACYMSGGRVQDTTRRRRRRREEQRLRSPRLFVGGWTVRTQRNSRSSNGCSRLCKRTAASSR